MNKYLLIVIIFLICLTTYNLALSLTSTKQQARLEVDHLTEQAPRQRAVEEQGSAFLENALKNIFLTWKNFQDKFVAWWQRNILLKLKQWYETKKRETKQELQKETRELKEEMKEAIKKFFFKLWQEIKDIL